MSLDSFKTNIAPLGSSNIISQFESVNVVPYGPGSNCDLSSVAQITQKSDNVILNLFDASTTVEVGKNIQSNKTLSDILGSLNPNVDESSGTISIKIPPVNAERKSKIVKLVKDSHSKYVKNVRNHRKQFMDQCKAAVKDGTGKDDGKRREKEGEVVVKSANADGESVLDGKIAEID
ncbi:hypothetical protein TL16_g11031 [Triparma laevis f. inornata]|uniref:Ribosome recycling factor domain-containing protein n=2 Tax=Triparma laevis TaxID=1534972 RepID=A0A9W7FDB7_9STRA|nr:hypothetical protein TL16_g11031 [Triparma laevis f. inornata]GMI10034.1 hypothetical protein TrLO_g15348 [Triparma laevis f. longispina]